MDSGGESRAWWTLAAVSVPLISVCINTTAIMLPIYVGIAVNFSDVNSVLGSIQPGDDIDIIASYVGAEGGNTKNDAPKQTP